MKINQLHCIKKKITMDLRVKIRKDKQIDVDFNYKEVIW